MQRRVCLSSQLKDFCSLGDGVVHVNGLACRTWGFDLIQCVDAKAKRVTRYGHTSIPHKLETFGYMNNAAAKQTTITFDTGIVSHALSLS